MIYAKRIEWERRDIETQPKENKQMLKEEQIKCKTKTSEKKLKIYYFTGIKVSN